ncbi:unnamed protein product [Rotaria sp. Silwood1]|nr:unnamed protein product [Rotaria sp. Silwood1]
MIALVAEIHSVDSQLHKKQQETVEHLKHPPNRTERKKIDNYIHLCKPMVTLSLKKYVNSNEAEFQPNIFLFFIALSAIEPVVYDLFLVRLKTDNKELEVQRMFIVQTLFELVRYNKSLSDHLFSRYGLNLIFSLQTLIEFYFDEDDLIMSLINYGLCKSDMLLVQTIKESNEFYQHLIERCLKYLTKTNAYTSCLFILESHEDDLNKSLIIILKQTMLSLLFKDDILDINDNLTQHIIFIGF